jgi:hypothetical protein
MLLVVVGHERVVQAEHAIGIGFGDHFGNKGVLVVVEVHVADHQQVALKFMVFLALEKRRSDEEQLQLLQLVKLKHSHLVVCLLVRTQKSPLEFGESSEVLHLGDPEGGVLGDDDGSAFDFLVQNLDQSGRGVEGQVG